MSVVERPSERLLTEQQTAEFLGVRISTLQKWRWAGLHLRFVKVGNRLVRYRMSDLVAYIDSQTRDQTLKTDHDAATKEPAS